MSLYSVYMNNMIWIIRQIFRKPFLLCHKVFHKKLLQKGILLLKIEDVIRSIMTEGWFLWNRATRGVRHSQLNQVTMSVLKQLWLDNFEVVWDCGITFWLYINYIYLQQGLVEDPACLVDQCVPHIPEWNDNYTATFNCLYNRLWEGISHLKALV